MTRTHFRMILEQNSASLAVVGLTLFIFGLLVWTYVVAIQITHPAWLDESLTHYDVAPFDWRVDDIGILAFGVAAFGFVVWRVENSISRKDH